MDILPVLIVIFGLPFFGDRFMAGGAIIFGDVTPLRDFRLGMAFHTFAFRDFQSGRNGFTGFNPFVAGRTFNPSVAVNFVREFHFVQNIGDVAPNGFFILDIIRFNTEFGCFFSVQTFVTFHATFYRWHPRVLFFGSQFMTRYALNFFVNGMLLMTKDDLRALSLFIRVYATHHGD
jgi:hypothetical protein